MERSNSFIKKHGIFILMLFIYAVANIFFLEQFPFMHSDESWLSGLSQTVLNEGRFDLTEPFYDLYPRNPHAIKIFFVAIQAFVINLFGHSLFNMRMISLVSSLLSLSFFYRIIINRFYNRNFALLATGLLAVDIEFIYASHMARQESILLLISLAAYDYFMRKSPPTTGSAAMLAVILALGIGIHPNSFIISIPFGLMLFYRFLKDRARGIDLLAFTVVLGGGAAFFIALSLRMDPGFIGNYAAYGQTLGVTESLLSKLLQIKMFYQKLFHQVSGTYYTPDIRLQLLLMIPTSIWGMARLVKSKGASGEAYPILGLIGINLGYLLVGRYNQTSIVFLFPWFYLLTAELLYPLKKHRNAILGILLAATLSISCFHIAIHPGKDYSAYLEKISSQVPEDARVLANLNTGYYFNPDNLRDYRNLAHLRENSLSFGDYIDMNQIEFILYPEEMDIIWNTRPVYNSLYGNPADYYESMKTFLDENCMLVGSFTDDTYPIRIVRLMGQKERTLRIYKVLD
jgi:hypothetical protein